MQRSLSFLVKNTFISGLKRSFGTTKKILNKEEKDVQKKNPFCLEPLVYQSHTLRKHDNPRRQRLYEFGMYVAACLPKYVQLVQMQHTGDLEIMVAPEGLFPVCSFLAHHQHACFNTCTAVTAVDVPAREYRFEVIYFIRSLRYGEILNVKTYTDELTPLHSAFELWKGVNWYEREVYDMFGVVFTHHPDLRRILTDYGFTGHPLRKDFPTVGYIEVRYDDEVKKIVYEPVEYAQEGRRYQLQSPWTYYRNYHAGYNDPMPPPKK